jgi:adenosylcobinamide-GDP ribazoletransferase
MWGRWASIYAIFCFPPARAAGMGRTFHDHLHRTHFVVATASALVIGAVVLPPWGALVMLIVWLVGRGLAGYMLAALGGLTGDTYGALTEVGEMVTLLTFAALHQHSVL